MPTITEPPQAPPTEPTPAAPELRDVEVWAALHKTPDLWFKAAKTASLWALGSQTTEAEYLAAVNAAQHGA